MTLNQGLQNLLTSLKFAGITNLLPLALSIISIISVVLTL